MNRATLIITIAVLAGARCLCAEELAEVPHAKSVHAKRAQVYHVPPDDHAMGGGAMAAGVPSASLGRLLNHLANWHVEAGKWRQRRGRIVGSGESGLTFNHDLPVDFILEFKMRVLHGMRPRVYFKTVYVGNEGFQKTIDLFGADATGTPFPYHNDQTLSVRLAFQGENVELHINGKAVAGAKRKEVANERLAISGGDGWSQGTTEYFDFTVTPLTSGDTSDVWSFESKEAKGAIEGFNRQVLEAGRDHEAALKTLLAAHRETVHGFRHALIEKLEVAVKQACRDEDLDEAIRIREVLRQVQQTAKSYETKSHHQHKKNKLPPSAPASQPSPAAGPGARPVPSAHRD